MQHELLVALAHQGVDLLLVLRGAERDRGERLGLAAGEQRRAVSARKHLDLGADLPDIGRFAVIDSLVLLDDDAADALADDFFASLAEFLIAVGKTRSEFGHGLVRQCVNGRAALFFACYCERRFELGRHPLARRLENRRIEHLGLELALGLAGQAAQLALQLEDRGQQLMRGEQRLKDRLLVDYLRAALEHHDRVRLGRDYHRDVALLELLGGRIGDQLAVDAAHPHRRHRPGVRDVGDFERGRSSNQREHVGVVVAVNGKHRDDDLGFLVVALGEQRAHRAVDEPRGQDFLFRGTALAFKKAAGDFAGGESALLVIHRERQEVDIGTGVVGRHDCREDHGFAVLRQHRAMRLLGQPSGLERQLAAGKIQFEFSNHLIYT